MTLLCMMQGEMPSGGHEWAHAFSVCASKEASLLGLIGTAFVCGAATSFWDAL